MCTCCYGYNVWLWRHVICVFSCHRQPSIIDTRSCHVISGNQSTTDMMTSLLNTVTCPTASRRYVGNAMTSSRRNSVCQQQEMKTPSCIDTTSQMTSRMRHHVTSTSSRDVKPTCAICLVPVGAQLSSSVEQSCLATTGRYLATNDEDDDIAGVHVSRDATMQRWWSSVPRSGRRETSQTTWRRSRSTSDLLRLILVTSLPAYNYRQAYHRPENIDCVWSNS